LVAEGWLAMNKTDTHHQSKQYLHRNIYSISRNIFL
jgi:hypothetical protein